MPVDQVQKLINAIDNNKTEFTYTPIISKKLRELVKIPEPEKKLADELRQQAKHTDNKFNELEQQNEQIRSEIIQTKDELKQQIEDLKDLLNNFIKNSVVNNCN